MRIQRRGNFDIDRLREEVDDVKSEIDRVKKRLEPLKIFSERVEAAANVFFDAAKSAGDSLPENVGRETIDRELLRVTKAMDCIDAGLCDVGVRAYEETEAEILKPLEEKLEAAERALDVAEREQYDREYFRNVA